MQTRKQHDKVVNDQMTGLVKWSEVSGNDIFWRKEVCTGGSGGSKTAGASGRSKIFFIIWL
ncbi:hypothetical protein [Paenibacillus odorifer]|uniref:hypothetical protein n=1 Tax=Paenibacillus odorifer TaxID=189426 RepID=UPI0015C32954|nr:hypothetical protein [Paenibacillus odorifer]